MVAIEATQDGLDADGANEIGQGRDQGAGAGAGEGDAPDAGQEGNNAGRVHYVCTFYRGTLPAPTGEVAQLVNRSATTAVLRARAESFYAFLSDPASDLRDLNGDNTLFTAMISVPGTNKVKIIYGMGLGTAQIGQVNPVANKIMALFGEGGSDLGTPQVLVVNPSIRDRVAVKSVRDTVIEQAFNTGITVDKHVAKAINVPEELQIMRIAPIPAYMVFDGFNEDLDASMVYERLMASIFGDDDRSAMLDHALDFLRSCMIGVWRLTDRLPSVPHEEFYCMLPTTAR